ncbi:MAG: hypothetical protein U1E78_06055 [Gammaproteobacteria bacterium]
MNLSQHIPALAFNSIPTDGLHQVVLKALKASRIQTTSELPAPILKLNREQWETRTLAYGPDSRPVRERLTLTSPFELVSSDASETLLKGTLTIERDRQLDPRLVLADSEEKQILQSEMRFDAAQQLLYQLAALNW